MGKGTKRTAEEEVDGAKKQKTENGANGAGNGAAAEENGANVEEEEDVDEEDEEAQGEEEEDGEGEEEGRRRLNFLVCCHPTSSFRTTYTKYATSSSSLLYKKRGIKRSTASVRKVPQSKRAKCQTNSLLSTKRPNIR